MASKIGVGRRVWRGWGGRVEGWESGGGAESSLRHRLAIDETIYIHGTQILC